MKRPRLVIFAAVFAWSAALAQPAPDIAFEARLKRLEADLRCLVCQNQTLAESNAPLAVDLRSQIRDQLARGASEREVREFMVARYGDFVLYKPPLKASTVALWLGPFALLVAGFALLVRRLRRPRSPEPALSPAERERAAKLLE